MTDNNRAPSKYLVDLTLPSRAFVSMKCTAKVERISFD